MFLFAFLPLFFLFLHFGARPLILQCLIFPEAVEEKKGLGMALFKTPQPPEPGQFGTPFSTFIYHESALHLPHSHSSLVARALWRVPASGAWSLELLCDDYGSVHLDGDPVMVQELKKHSRHLTHRTVQLDAGSHLLELRLANGKGKGNLRFRVKGPGDSAYRLLNSRELRHIELGNLELWLGLASGLEWTGVAGLWLWGVLLTAALATGRWRGPLGWLAAGLRRLGRAEAFLLIGAGLALAFHIWAMPLWLESQVFNRPDLDKLYGGKGLASSLPAGSNPRPQIPMAQKAAGQGQTLDFWLWLPRGTGQYAFWLKTQGQGRGDLFLDATRKISPFVDGGRVRRLLAAGPKLLVLRLSGQGEARAELLLQTAFTQKFGHFPAGSLIRLDSRDLAGPWQWLRLAERMALVLAAALALLAGWWLLRRLAPEGLLRRLPWPTREATVAVVLAAMLSLGGYALNFTAGYGSQDYPIRYDGVGYYSYLPAWFLQGDPSFQGLLGPFIELGYNRSYTETIHPITGLEKHPDMMGYFNKYNCGVALMMLPFFALGHLATVAADFPTDGFSFFYQHAVALGGTFYGLAGFLLIAGFLSHRFRPKTTLVTLAVLLFGTTLYHSLTHWSSSSHPYSFFLFALVVTLAPAWLHKPDWPKTVALGLLLGLIPLVRTYNVAVLVLYLGLFGVVGWATAKQRAGLFLANWRRLSVLLLVGVLVFTPQFVVWKLVSGEWLATPYRSEEGFIHFASPYIWSILFGVRKGLFFWHPLLLTAVAGLFFMGRRLPGHLLPMGVFLALVTYLMASWYSWFFGACFGHRGFIESLALLALPMSCLFDWVHQKSKPVQRWAYAACLALLGLSIFQMYQYWVGIIPQDGTTWEVYKNIFLSL